MLRQPNESRKLLLKFNPGNKYDVNAIEVYDGSTMLGHLDRGTAIQIAALVHQVFDNESLSRLEKVKYHLLAKTSIVGDRVYATIIGCFRNNDTEEN